MTNLKIERLGRALMDDLIIRFKSATNATPVVAAHDASGDLYLTVTDGVGSSAIVKFEVEPVQASGQYDSLGLAQTVYTPHVTKLGLDAGAPGTRATATATLLAALTSTDVVTVNGHAFTAMDSGAAGDQFNLVGVAATGTIVLASVIATNTVVINGVTLTAHAATQDATNFVVGASDADTATNLCTTIAANPTLSAIVTAANGGTATVTLTAIKLGTAGNAYTLADGGAGTFTVSAATMGAGAGQTVGALNLNSTATNLAAAITASVTAGVQNVVTATSTGASAVVTLRAVSVGVAGNTITLAETGGHVTVSGANLTGGTNATPAGTSNALRYALVAECAPTGTALLIYEKAGIVVTDLTNVALLVSTVRSIPWGMLAQM